MTDEPKVLTFRDKPITECSREELIAAVLWLWEEREQKQSKDPAHQKLMQQARRHVPPLDI